MTRSSRADVGAVSRRWEYEGTLPACFGIFPSTDGGEPLCCRCDFVGVGS